MFEFRHILEICRAIVKGISVDVVGYHTIRGVCYDSVHTQKPYFTVNFNFCTGVKQAAGLFRIPVKHTQSVKPFRVTKGVHSVLQLDRIKRGSRKRLNDFDQHFQDLII